MQGAVGRGSDSARRQLRSKQLRPATLSPHESDSLRGQLVSELAQQNDAGALAKWAHRILPLKNRLSASDAQVVEEAFSAKLSQLENVEESAVNRDENNRDGQSQHIGLGEQQVTVISKPVRERDRNHVRFVASQGCLVCGRTPSDAHHIKLAEPRAMGRKVSDKFTVPICRLHHRELHRRGDERIWWEKQGIDPLPVAARLWKTTHAVDSTKAVLAGDLTGPTRLDGKHLMSGLGAVIPGQDSKTKPIVRTELK